MDRKPCIELGSYYPLEFRNKNTGNEYFHLINRREYSVMLSGYYDRDSWWLSLMTAKE